LDWVPAFETGIAEMDAQHKQLITLANQMYASFKFDKNKKEIKENIRSFMDFASYHFGNEENYLEKFNFEFAKEHSADHKLFLKTLSQFQIDYAANKVKFLDNTMESIKKWLFHHFSEVDKKYIPVFKENGM